jgi:hypothetical protein
MSAFILCSCRLRPWNGLIPRPRSPTDSLRLRNWSETKRFTDALCSKVGATEKDIYIYILKILIMQFSLSSVCLIMFIIAMFVIGSGDWQADMQVAFKLSEFNFDPTESLNEQTYDVLCSRTCFLVFLLDSMRCTLNQDMIAREFAPSCTDRGFQRWPRFSLVMRTL